MTGPLLLLSQAAAGGVRCAAYLLLISRLLPARRADPRPAAAALAIAAALSGAMAAAGLPDFLRMAAEVLYLTLFAVRLQGAGARMCLFVGIFYEIAVSLWQFLAGAWLGVILGSPAFLDGGSIRGQGAIWLLHGPLAAGALYLWRHPHAGGRGALRAVSVSMATGLAAVVGLSQQAVIPIAEDSLDMWTTLAVILMLAVLVFRMSRQYEMERELARLKSQQAELLERDYTVLSQSYAVNARLFHDLHNHIGALRQLLSHRKLEEALAYLDQLQEPVREIADTVWTGDETVDYLINSKAQAAEAAGIRYQAQVEFPRRTSLGSGDLCAVVGNLLDNALEAAGQVPEGEDRFVRLTIRRINHMLVIKVENSFVVQPVEGDGGLQTTKEDSGIHGWGLKSAQTAAEKYDGTVQISYTGNTFRAVATLSFQGTPAGDR